MATIMNVTLMADGFTRALKWDEVIGIDSKDINIEIEAADVQASLPLTVEVTSRLPNGGSKTGTITTPLKWDMPPLTAATTGRATFKLTKKIADAGAFLSTAGVQDVCSVV